MKRQRSFLDNGENEVMNLEIDQSKLQRAPVGSSHFEFAESSTDSLQRKRPRVSNDDLDEHDSDALSGDDDGFLQQATQFATQQKTKSQVQNEAADNGIIESVTCTNFMCHSHLEITLGPLINFIIGHNGSGKSAVLTALTICLGGKASATNRGQSLKSFIKEGHEYV